MWQRKNAEQIVDNKRKERSYLWISFKEPIVLFMIVFLLCVVTAGLGPYYAVNISGPTSFKEALVDSVTIAMVISIIGYMIQAVSRRKLSYFFQKYWSGYHTVICNKCYRVKWVRQESKISCDCGGTFEDFDKWEWVE